MKLLLSIFLFGFFISEFIIQKRIFEKCGIQNTISKIIILIFIVFSSFLIKYGFILSICVSFIPLFTFSFFFFIRKIVYQRKKIENYLLFLEKLLLKIKNQKSLSLSLHELEKEGDAFMQQNGFIHDNFVLFSTHKNKKLNDFSKKVFKKLKFVKENSHQTQIFLEEWLKDEKLKYFFRHKSGQISFQTRFQSILVLGMYFVFLILQWQTHGKEVVLHYFLMSLPIMLLGLGLSVWIGRNFKWKV